MVLACRKIGAHAGMTILELGCGWGSFAKCAAEKYGASVVGYNIPEQQVALGHELCQGLPGYAWYVPKAEGYLNVGIGWSAARLRAKGQTLNEHCVRLVAHLDRSGLVRGHTFQPMGYSYYLRGRAPQGRRGNALLVGDALGLATRDMGEGITAVIHSGLLAVQVIVEQCCYTVSAIPRYSLPSLLRLRRSAV